MSIPHHLEGIVYHVSTAFIHSMFFFGLAGKEKKSLPPEKEDEKYVQIRTSHHSLDSGWCAEIASLMRAIYVPQPLVTNMHE